MGLSSCVYDDGLPDDIDVPEADLAISFRIALKDVSPRLAASARTDDETWGGDYEKDLATGFAYENTIVADELQVFICNMSNVVVGTVTMRLCYPLEKNGDIYEYVGTIRPIGDTAFEHGGQYKIMVLANSPGYIMENGPMKNLRYAWTAPDNGSLVRNVNYIPMCGIKTFEFDTEKGERQNIGDIYMLRAVAKVTVCLNDRLADEGYRIDSLMLSWMQSSGYCMPKEFAGYSNTLDVPTDGCFMPFPDYFKTGFTQYNRTDDLKRRDIYFFMPEMSYREDTYIEVGMEDPEGNPFTGKIYLGVDYIGGKPSEDANHRWNIIRNHHYKYTVSGVPKDDDGFKFNVEIEKMIDGGTYDYEYNNLL